MAVLWGSRPGHLALPSLHLHRPLPRRAHLLLQCRCSPAPTLLSAITPSTGLLRPHVVPDKTTRPRSCSVPPPVPPTRGHI